MDINKPGILAGASVNSKKLELLRMECLKLALQATGLSRMIGVTQDAAPLDVVDIAREFERYVTGNATGREAD